MNTNQIRAREWVAEHEPGRVCLKCLDYHTHEHFSIAYLSSGLPRLHSYCKDCRNQQAKDRAMLGRRKDIKCRSPAREEIWPRALGEVLLDVGARRWRYPVARGQLTPALRMQG